MTNENNQKTFHRSTNVSMNCLVAAEMCIRRRVSITHTPVGMEYHYHKLMFLHVPHSLLKKKDTKIRSYLY